jgi:hypothetical protein
VQEDHQVLRALVQDAVASVREPDPELAQLAFDLGGDRERRGGASGGWPFRYSSTKSSIFAARLGGRAWMNSSTG